MVVWWLTLLGSGVAVVATWIELGAALGEAAVRAALLHAAVAQLAWLLAAALSLSVLRFIQRREDARAARIPDAAGSGQSVVAPVAVPVGAIGLPGAVRVPVGATPGSAAARVVDGVTRSSAGSTPEGAAAERRGSVGMFLAVAAFFIVGFILVPWLLSSSPGAGTTVPSGSRSLVPVWWPWPLVGAPILHSGAVVRSGSIDHSRADVLHPAGAGLAAAQLSPGPSGSGNPAGSPVTGSRPRCAAAPSSIAGRATAKPAGCRHGRGVSARPCLCRGRHVRGLSDRVRAGGRPGRDHLRARRGRGGRSAVRRLPVGRRDLELRRSRPILRCGARVRRLPRRPAG